MIKSLLDDEESTDGAEDKKRGFFRKSAPEPDILSIISEDEPVPDEGPGESGEELRNAFRGEVTPDPGKLELPPVPAETTPSTSGDLSDSVRRTEELERKLHEIEEELRAEKERLGLTTSHPQPVSATVPGPEQPAGPIGPPQNRPEIAVPFAEPEPKPFEPEPVAETFRKSSLAWSAGIALFGSVVFMLVLGWFADLLLGSSPWGIVTGIVVGSLIGFLQFFRITSQILRPGKSDFDKVSLVSRDDPEDRGAE